MLLATAPVALAVDCCICESCQGENACFTIELAPDSEGLCQAAQCAGGEFNAGVDCFTESECDVVNPEQPIAPLPRPAPVVSPIGAVVAIVAALAAAGMRAARRR